MKEDFKVYTNPKMKRRPKEEEITYELELLDEDIITALFISSPYFMEALLSQDYFYYPVDVEAEESLMAPILNKNVLRDFIKSTKKFCKREEVPAATLLHIMVEDEEGEQDMMPIFEGMMQIEFLKYFQTAVMLMNQELALEEDFAAIFEGLMDELATEGGYLDVVLNNICNYLSDPEVLESALFPEEDEE